MTFQSDEGGHSDLGINLERPKQHDKSTQKAWLGNDFGPNFALDAV